MKPITLAFVDDHPTLLKGLAALFAGDGYQIVGTGSSADDVVGLLECDPDVLVVDLSMPGAVFEAIRVARRGGDTKIVVFTAYADSGLALEAFDAGAHAFVLKGSPPDDLERAISSVLNGQAFVSPEFSGVMLGAVQARREAKRNAARLSAREAQIAGLLLEAKSNKEIARALSLSDKTVKHYMTNLMRKVGARNRIDVVLALRPAHPALQGQAEPETFLFEGRRPDGDSGR